MFVAERVKIGRQDVIVHYADIPDTDLTIGGIPCTTALRTVIDIATQTDAPELERIVRDCLERRLFSCAEAMARIAEPDMLTHPGAQLLRQALPR
jgi:hypothetical protein